MSPCIRLRWRARRCPCGQAWAVHSAEEAAAQIGFSIATLYRVQRRVPCGTKLHGMWHFTAAELRRLRRAHRPPARRTDRRQHYWSLNKDRINAERRARYADNPEPGRARSRAYYTEHRERVRIKQRLAYQRRKEVA